MTMRTLEVTELRSRLNAARVGLDYHKKRAATLAAEIRRLKAERKDDHRIGFQEGSAAATLTAYLAVADYGLPGIEWLQERISAAIAGKKHMQSNAVDEAVTRSVIEHMKKYDPKRAAEIEKSFADFLVGDSK
jgi:hypothetical protein